MAEQAQQFAFQAEVQRLLDLVIHSLYTDKEIFLRELVSNASDAIDRLRFEALTDPGLLPEGHEPRIRLVPDKESRTLTIEDDGIGMTRDEVVRNIGTIARSGTREALEQIKEKAAEGAAQLIGQFGVGFYSSFMVADRVELVTRKAGTDGAVRWTSSGDGSFTVDDAERDRPGTTIVLHLKPVDSENGIEDYTDRWVLQRIVRQHADFITYPILLPAEKPEEVPEGETPQPEKPLNSMKPIWARPPAEVTKEEYADFYKQISHDWSEPLETIHTRAEGLVEYQAVLFVPSRGATDLYYPGFKPNLRLYVKRMLVRENSEELLPRWMRWVRGAVDSPDLPLNVSREMLQSDRHVRQIRRALTRKVLDTLKKLLENDRARYETFWRELGRAVKEGVDSDYENRDALLGLLLFGSSRDAEALGTLAEYVERMPESQKDIWYLTGSSREQIENSPALEAFRDRGWEVLYLTDPVDELVVQSVTEFEGRKVRSAGKGAVELEEGEKKESGEEQKKEFEPFLEAVRKRVDTWVKEVRLSGRLTKSPAVLVVAEHDYSPQLERLLSQGRTDGYRQRRILELNASHPMVQGLRRRFDANPEDSVVGDYAELLLGWSLLAEGSEPHDPVRFTQLVAGLMETGLDAAPAPSASAGTDASAGESTSADAAPSDASVQAGTSTEADTSAEAGTSSEASGASSDSAAEEAGASAD
ncbi:molecular chaperone HtpG [Longimicrobium sp.]|uniref:molecular chaperone HtpG n=1 Tax=Longimicrobium sp. TaxID=2029185 RepID=UPI002E342D09|nr:molecular chaperone HtpG [Longimicrobium sp.]HEX6037897.1 molecular chaperone HtpG [Longimicrobium sp.]